MISDRTIPILLLNAQGLPITPTYLPEIRYCDIDIVTRNIETIDKNNIADAYTIEKQTVPVIDFWYDINFENKEEIDIFYPVGTQEKPFNKSYLYFFVSARCVIKQLQACGIYICLHCRGGIMPDDGIDNPFICVPWDCDYIRLDIADNSNAIVSDTTVIIGGDSPKLYQMARCSIEVQETDNLGLCQFYCDYIIDTKATNLEKVYINGSEFSSGNVWHNVAGVHLQYSINDEFISDERSRTFVKYAKNTTIKLVDTGVFTNYYAHDIGGIWVDSILEVISNITEDNRRGYIITAAYDCVFSFNYANKEEVRALYTGSYLENCKIELSVATTVESDASDTRDLLSAVVCHKCECIDCDVSISGNLEINYKRLDDDQLENWMQPFYNIRVFAYDSCLLTNCTYNINVATKVPPVDTRLVQGQTTVKICGASDDSSTCQRCEQVHWYESNVTQTNDCSKI